MDSKVNSSLPGYTQVRREDIRVGLSDSWKDPAVPKRQYESITVKELDRYRNNEPVQPFDALVNIIKESIPSAAVASILEIGCSTGYYSQVLKIKGISGTYHGCDYSDTFIAFASSLYPEIDFQVQDACSLAYATDQFDLVISGCCLLHIMDYEKAIAETARVAKKYVIFHRTPVLHIQDTSFYLKNAYGVDMFEIHFNEREFLRLIRDNGLTVLDIITFNITALSAGNDFFSVKTYLCSKI